MPRLSLKEGLRKNGGSDKYNVAIFGLSSRLKWSEAVSCYQQMVVPTSRGAVRTCVGFNSGCMISGVLAPSQILESAKCGIGAYPVRQHFQLPIPLARSRRASARNPGLDSTSLRFRPQHSGALGSDPAALVAGRSCSDVTPLSCLENPPEAPLNLSPSHCWNERRRMPKRRSELS